MTVGQFADLGGDERREISCGELIIGLKPSRASSPSPPATFSSR